MRTKDGKKYPKLWARAGYLYMRLEGVGGRYWASTSPDGIHAGLPVGEEEKAESLRLKTQHLIDVQRDLGLGESGPLSVEKYFTSWNNMRFQNGQISEDEYKKRKQRFKDHCAHLHKLQLSKVQVVDIADFNETLKQKIEAGTMAPRTAITIMGFIAQMFRRAVREKLIAATPCLLEREEKIEKVDKDPEFRENAIFEHNEIEMLISDERISLCDRTSHAFCFFLGLRPGEMAGATWDQYEPTYRVMPRIKISKTNKDQKARRRNSKKNTTKTGVTRYYPVHPTLAAMLAEWKFQWAATFGRQPTPEDLIFPTMPSSQPWNPRHKSGLVRSDNYTVKRTTAHLALLGLRHRRTYDFRHSFISLAVHAFGANPLVIEAMTHTPKPGKQGKAFDLYRKVSWESRCAEIKKIKIYRTETQTQSTAVGSSVERNADFGHTVVTLKNNLVNSNTSIRGVGDLNASTISAISTIYETTRKSKIDKTDGYGLGDNEVSVTVCVDAEKSRDRVTNVTKSEVIEIAKRVESWLEDPITTRPPSSDILFLVEFAKNGGEK